MTMVRRVNAVYIEQELRRMRGNRLIEALPPAADEEGVYLSLRLEPDFHPLQREWSPSMRIQQIYGLKHMMFPLARNVELGCLLDRIIREGYVGRAPETNRDIRSVQEIYEAQQQGARFSQEHYEHVASQSATLIGVTGMGKTTSVQRWLAYYPDIIDHPSLPAPQIPKLFIQTPTAGTVRALAIAIIGAISKLLPDFRYHEDYLSKVRTGDGLIYSAGRLLAFHHVGLLVVDEVHNLASTPARCLVVMSQLTALSNVTDVPILYIGRQKSEAVLNCDGQMARRASETPLPRWDRLKFEDDEPNEWMDFLRHLFRYQWVKVPLEISPAVARQMYHYSQGIIDLALMIFRRAQIRCIQEGDEELTQDWFQVAFENDFTLIHQLVYALASHDEFTLKKLGEYGEILDQIGGLLRKVENELDVPLADPSELNRRAATPKKAAASEQAEARKPSISNEKPRSKRSAKAAPTGYLAAYADAQTLGQSVIDILDERGQLYDASKATLPK